MTSPSTGQARRSTFYRRRQAGFSLVEMIVVVGVISILAGISIVTFKSTNTATKEVVARNTLETMNEAVHRFNEANYEIYYNGPAGITEMQILRTLQYRNSNTDLAAIGSPYMRDDWNPAISSSSNDYRLVWTGTLYKLAEPGTAGKGLKVDFSGGDMGTRYVFPPNFSLAGK